MRDPKTMKREFSWTVFHDGLLHDGLYVGQLLFFGGSQERCLL